MGSEMCIRDRVGAGGIGLQLNGSLNTLAWTQVSLILLVILATVFISEWVSANVRGAIIKRAVPRKIVARFYCVNLLVAAVSRTQNEAYNFGRFGLPI